MLTLDQVFYTTSHSFALVNLKPLLPGHVLVSPLRRVPRLSDLHADEVSDLFLSVQRVGRTIERLFKASALNVAVQDGVDAGQSVPHVHVHVIPRRKGDMDEHGGNDAIYGMLEGEEGNVGRHQREKEAPVGERPQFPAPDAERKPRSHEEMEKEASWLAEELAKDRAS